MKSFELDIAINFIKERQLLNAIDDIDQTLE